MYKIEYNRDVWRHDKYHIHFDISQNATYLNDPILTGWLVNKSDGLIELRLYDSEDSFICNLDCEIIRRGLLDMYPDIDGVLNAGFEIDTHILSNKKKHIFYAYYNGTRVAEVLKVELQTDTLKITKIDPHIDYITFCFNKRHSGLFKCFNEEHRLTDQDTLKIKYREDMVYESGYFFRPEQSAGYEVFFPQLDFTNILIIDAPFRSRHKFSNENTFFLCRNLYKSHKELIRRCNVAVVMTYRAIDINRPDLVTYCSNILDELIDRIDPNQKQASDVKTNATHVFVSLCYLRALVAVYLSQEKVFVNNLNTLLSVARITKDRTFISSAYFSLVLSHQLIACYVSREQRELIYRESLILFQQCCVLHDADLCNVRMQELMACLSNLASLKSFTASKSDKIDELFLSALRCSQKSLLLNNFKKFHKNMKLDVDSYKGGLSNYSKLLRDKANLFEDL